MILSELLADSSLAKKAILQKLVIHRLGLSKEELYTRSDTEIQEIDTDWIRGAYKEYTVDHKPLEYIVGHVAFHGVRFTVTPATLIPRPETEYMIDAVNEWCVEHVGVRYGLLDIGTGCGVLGCSALLHNPDSFDSAVCSDVSAEALDVARSNAERLIPGRQVQFVEANLCDHEAVRAVLDGAMPVVLVANLPYIPEKLFYENTDKTVHDWEPSVAFLGGEDGLDLYRVMFDQLVAGGWKPVQFLEMMTRQVDILRKEYGEKLVFEEIKTFHFNIRIVRVVGR